MREWAGAILVAVLIMSGIVWLNCWLFDFVFPKPWMNYQAWGIVTLWLIALALARLRMNRLNAVC